MPHATTSPQGNRALNNDQDDDVWYGPTRIESFAAGAAIVISVAAVVMAVRSALQAAGVL